MPKVVVNNRWEVELPEHRAVRPEWPVWEKERLDAMHETIKPGDIVFDIGAEEGDFPALFTLWGATVIPFEPNPYVWPNIRWIWEANGFTTPPAYFAGFASDKTNLWPSDIEPIFKESQSEGWPACAYGPVIGDHGFRNVSERFHDTPQITIDDFCNDKGLYPNVITIDVEGAELVVLTGASKTLTDHKPMVFVSIHPEPLMDMYGNIPDDVVRFMANHGYSATHLITDHEQHWMFT